MRLIHFIQLSNLQQIGQKKKLICLDVDITLNNGVLSTDLLVKPTDTHQFLDPISCHPYHCKKGILIVKHQVLIGFSSIIIILINDAASWKVGC